MSAFSAIIGKTGHHLANVVRAIRVQSSFKVIFILIFAIGMESGLWALFLSGFRFLDTLGGAGVMIISRLFSFFFMGMGMMLILSCSLSAYSTIYRSDEVPFLIVRPFSMSHIVMYKFVEAAGLASWAFFFIIVPFVGAFAWYEGLSVFFALWTFLFSIPFLLLCAGLGSFVTILFIRFLPRSGMLKLIWAIAIAASCVVAMYVTRNLGEFSDLQFTLSHLVPGLALSSNPLLPSWWVSEGIMSLSRGQWSRGLMLWTVTVSSAAVVCMVVEWVGGHVFYEGWLRVSGGRGQVNRSPVMLAGLDRALRILPSDVRALLMKDIRTFLRDPMQWSQVLIYFGLLGVYFANLRTFRYHVWLPGYRNTIAFLNVFSVSAVMCSVGSRFVYPQLSLEGQGFWTLGLSPMTMKRVLVTKFLSALAGMMMVSIPLMLLSLFMLKAAATVTVVALAVAVAESLAVAALSVGLGAIFLDLKSRNPAAIVSGFGGTLNLVLNLCFMLLTIIPFGLLFNLRAINRIADDQLLSGIVFASVWLLVLTAATVAIPLYAGCVSLANREF